MSSHLKMVTNPCATFYRASTWICEIASSYNANEWGALVTTDSISSGAQLRPTKTGHPTCAYCSNKLASECCLALHLENTIPCKFLSMTPSFRVNSSSIRCRSSANTVADLIFRQCCGKMSYFGVGCTDYANALNSRFLLRLALD